MAAATMAPARTEPKMTTENTALEKPAPTPPVITTPAEYTQSLSKWQSQHFHVLTPAANFSGLPPQYGMVAALVQLNPDPNGGDVYQDPLFCNKEKGEVAIAKIGLSKIAQAAGMTIKTERTDPRTIASYWEVRATARFIGLDGRPQEIDATVEYDLRDTSPRVRNWSEKQRQAARAYGLRGAEARAINAAIRQFGIRQKYTQDELRKPFVTLRVMFQPDMSDPDTRRLVTQQALQGTTALYPASGRELPPPEHLGTIGDVAGADQPRSVGSGSTTASTPPTTEHKAAAPDPDQPPCDGAVRIAKAEEKPFTYRKGAKAGTQGMRYVIVDSLGVEHSTFEKGHYDDALKFKAENAWVEINEETDGEYKNLIEITRAGAQPSLLPDPGQL